MNVTTSRAKKWHVKKIRDIFFICCFFRAINERFHSRMNIAIEPFWLSSCPGVWRRLGSLKPEIYQSSLAQALAFYGAFAFHEANDACVSAVSSLVWSILCFLAPTQAEKAML